MSDVDRRPRVRPSGPLLFARYAYPPNVLGLCGPDDHGSLLEHVDGHIDDEELRQLARGFEGAWPYLELIAAANAVDDALDERVVQGYWIGNDLAARVAPRELLLHLDDRFRLDGATMRPGGPAARAAELSRRAVVDAALAGLPPTHGFHVFAVYPWVGLLREGRRDPALHVLDSCRISWGRVTDVEAGMAVVESRRVLLGLSGLELAPPTIVSATLQHDGASLAGDVRPGDLVSLHWDWVCDRLTPQQADRLHRTTEAYLAVANRACGFGPGIDPGRVPPTRTDGGATPTPG